MSLKPIDIQTNILQMNNAAAELNKQKGSNINNVNYAASMTEKASVEKSSKIEETDKVEPTLHALDNEEKDKSQMQGQGEGEKKQKKELNEKEKEDLKLFDDPSKGHFIDIKE